MFHNTFFRSVNIKFGSYESDVENYSRTFFKECSAQSQCFFFFLVSEFTVQNSSGRNRRAPSCLPLLLAAWKRLYRSSLKTPEGNSAVHCMLHRRPCVIQNLRQTMFPASARFERKPHLSMEDCDDVHA